MKFIHCVHLFCCCLFFSFSAFTAAGTQNPNSNFLAEQKAIRLDISATFESGFVLKEVSPGLPVDIIYRRFIHKIQGISSTHVGSVYSKVARGIRCGFFDREWNSTKSGLRTREYEATDENK